MTFPLENIGSASSFKTFYNNEFLPAARQYLESSDSCDTINKLFSSIGLKEKLLELIPERMTKDKNQTMSILELSCRTTIPKTLVPEKSLFQSALTSKRPLSDFKSEIFNLASFDETTSILNLKKPLPALFSQEILMPLVRSKRNETSADFDSKDFSTFLSEDRLDILQEQIDGEMELQK